MRTKQFSFLLLFFLSSYLVIAQDMKIAGNIVDAQTNEPLYGVAIYISGTSTGVASGMDGKYAIIYSPEYNAPLVFSYLGYEKLQIMDPSKVNLSLVKLQLQEDELDAVVIDPDPWDRATKERFFRDYFVGQGSLENASISNIKEVNLRFNPTSKQLTATSNNPIQVRNTYLGYVINYDLEDFEINFNFFPRSKVLEEEFYIHHAPERYRVENIYTAGYSFYQELDNKRLSNRQRERRREKAYRTSGLKLYRSIINQSLKTDKFDLFYNGFQVDPASHIRVKQVGDNFKITFRHTKYSITDRDGNQTDLILKSQEILMDPYGNNLSPRDVILSGYLSQLGVGGMMPLDYDLKSGK